MSRFGRSLRTALRAFARSPLFTLTALSTLALGIAASTAVFSVVNGVLLQPLPFYESDRLVDMRHEVPGLDLPEVPQSPATYMTYRADTELLEEMALMAFRRLSVTGRGDPEEVEALLVTDGFLDVLGVRPILGRDFLPEDDRPGAPERILVSHAYWERALGADPAAVGRTLEVSGVVREVIGVLPEGLQILNFNPAILYPAGFDPDEVFMGNFSYQGIGRLRPGATIEQLELEVDRLARIAVDRYPGPLTLSMMEQAQFGPNLQPLKESLVGDLRTPLWVLLGTVGLVLLIACANVANLFLVRAEGRVQEMAVRTALGATRRRLASTLLSEAIALGLMGGAVGVALAWAGLRILRYMEPGRLPRLQEIGLNPTVLLFALGVSFLCALGFGLVPLIRYGSPALTSALKEGGRGGSAGKRRSRVRNGLVIGQIALALVLLVGSGLMVRTFVELRDVSPGFEVPEDALTFRITIPGALVEDPFEAFGAMEQVLRRLRDLPGVVSAGAASSLPLDDSDSNDALYVESQPTEPGTIPPVRRMVWTTPGHFDAMGIPVLVGRDLSWEDLQVRRRVMLISESFAREVWGDPVSAIGDRAATINIADEDLIWHEIVGVVGDARYDGLDQPVVPIAYWPAVQDELYGEGPEVRRGLAYLVRPAPGFSGDLLAAVREIVGSEAPGVPVAGVATMGDLVSRSLARVSFILVMLGIAATVALLLGAIGLYGVVSYTVSQRGREIGIRMALGAEKGAVGRMIVHEGVLMAGIGVALGLVGAAALTQLMESLLYEVTPLDVPTYLVGAAALTALAALASWVPARRAAGLDPVRMLRQE